MMSILYLPQSLQMYLCLPLPHHMAAAAGGTGEVFPYDRSPIHGQYLIYKNK